MRGRRGAKIAALGALGLLLIGGCHTGLSTLRINEGDDPLRLVSARCIGAVQVRMADVRARAEAQAVLEGFAESVEDPAERMVLNAMLARAERLAFAFDVTGGREPAAMAVVSGNFSDMREVAQGAWRTDARGADVLALPGEPALRLILARSGHLILAPPELEEPVLDTLIHPERSLAKRISSLPLARQQQLHAASLSAVVIPLPFHRDLVRQSAENAELAPLLEHIEAILVAASFRDPLTVELRVLTAGEELAAFLKDSTEQVVREALRTCDDPLCVSAREVSISREHTEILARWSGAFSTFEAGLRALLEQDVGPTQDPFELVRAEDGLRRALAATPDAAQVRADLGWVLLRTGKLDEGIALLRAAVLAPSSIAPVRFPQLPDAATHPQQLLRVIEALHQVGGEDGLLLTHIWLEHVASDKLIERFPLAELEARAQTSDALIYLEALRGALEAHGDVPGHRLAAERIVSMIEARDLRFERDPDHHLAHLYFNAAVGHARMGDFDLAKHRLHQTLRIDPASYGWSARGPDLAPLREAMGEAAFQSEFMPPRGTP